MTLVPDGEGNLGLAKFVQMEAAEAAHKQAGF